MVAARRLRRRQREHFAYRVSGIAQVFVARVTWIVSAFVIGGGRRGIRVRLQLE
jgi:hypothetical protein